MFRKFASLGQRRPVRLRVAMFVAVTCLAAANAPTEAGTVHGRLDLPPAPARPATTSHGFLAALPNLLAPIRSTDPTPYMFVMLDAGTPMPAAAAQIELAIVGERFSQTLLALPMNAELVIKNSSNTPRALRIAEAPQLLPKVQINPTGKQAFRPLKAGDVYTISDSEAMHLTATVVVTPSMWVAPVSPDGKFEFANIPEGKYAIKVYYKSGWIDKPEPDSVTVTASGKVELRTKIPAGFPVKK